MENMKLNNNLECPMLGLGTFMLSSCSKTVGWMSDTYTFLGGTMSCRT